MLKFWSALGHLIPFQKRKSKRRLKDANSTEVALYFCQKQRDQPGFIKKYINPEIGRKFAFHFQFFTLKVTPTGLKNGQMTAMFV